MIIKPPITGTLSPYYESYRRYIADEDLLTSLNDELLKTSELILSLNETQGNFRYADGKWTVKEVLGHVSDTERILAYRALCIMRGENQSLLGFDENDYMKNSNFSTRTLGDILNEFESVRKATISLFTAMDENRLDKIGIANGNQVTVRALIYFILAHERHHLLFIKSKYLSK